MNKILVAGDLHHCNFTCGSGGEKRRKSRFSRRLHHFVREPLGHSYVRLVESGLKKAGCRLVVIPAGVCGSHYRNMLKRTPKLLEKKPDWLLSSCGINDVNRVSLEEYRKNITAILDMGEFAGIKVMLLTPPVYGEDLQGKYNREQTGYAEFLREQAAARKLLFADADKAFQQEIQHCPRKGKNNSTVDELHLNGYRNQLLARTVLSAFGMKEQMLERPMKEWNEIPSMIPLTNKWHDPAYLVTIPEYELLYDEVTRRKKTGYEYSLDVIRNHAAELKRRKTAVKN